jgi:hypothetical protein
VFSNAYSAISMRPNAVLLEAVFSSWRTHRADFSQSHIDDEVNGQISSSVRRQRLSETIDDLRVEGPGWHAMSISTRSFS